MADNIDRRLALCGVGAATLMVLTPPTGKAHAASSASGILALLQVCAQKTTNANNAALDAANKQQDLVRKQRQLNPERLEVETARLNDLEKAHRTYTAILDDLKKIQAEVSKLTC